MTRAATLVGYAVLGLVGWQVASPFVIKIGNCLCKGKHWRCRVFN